MLTSLLGIRLLLLVGKTIPLPAPPELTSALTQVQVTNDAQSGDGFQMTFTLGRSSPLDFSFFQTGVVDPLTRVIIAVQIGADLQVLIDGVITHHQYAPSDDPAGYKLTVTGRDLTVMLDLKEKNQKYENQPDSIIFAQIIAGYPQFGLIPKPAPTTVVPLSLQRTPWQQQTDLRFIQAMAQRNGFVFYIEPVTIGVNTAYFGPEIRAGIPQPAITIGMGGATNAKSLHVSLDALAPEGTEGEVYIPFLNTTIPIPPLPSLRVPPLAVTPTPISRTRKLRDTSGQQPDQAAVTKLAAEMRTPDSVTCTGEVDTVRYGSVLRARKLTSVRGLGFTHDGFYYVRSVTHSISIGGGQSNTYSQNFSLSREGTGALSPVVNMSGQFFGKYRGTVSDIQDPLMIGRIKAKVPDVMGDDESGWAMPSFPAGGSSMGIFALPSTGAGVWIEFEQGDPERPIWSGCFYGQATDLPSVLLTPPYKKLILQSAGGHSILIDDTPGIGGITLQTQGGQKVVLSTQGIEIDNGMGGSIKLQGPKVSVNSGALEVI